MTDRELMQQALDALVRMHSYGDVFRYQNWQANPYEQVSDAVIALRERLAQQEPEPFEYWNAVEGWVKIDEVREHFDSVGCGTIYKTAGEDRVPLYTAPPQRKPLTEQEPVAWLRVIDEAMVTHHLGVADPADDYETAKRKMNNLLCTAQDIGTFFAKTEPVQEPAADGLPLVVAGAIFDFAGYLTTRESVIDVGATANASPVADLVKAWANLRGLPLNDAAVLSWQEWLHTAPPQRKPLTEEEPVAWRFRETKNKQWSISDDGYYISCKRTSGYIIEPLYTTPPQRKPLTDDEIGLLTTDPRFAHIETPTLAEFARAVIAKVTGEKK